MTEDKRIEFTDPRYEFIDPLSPTEEELSELEEYEKQWLEDRARYTKAVDAIEEKLGSQELEKLDVFGLVAELANRPGYHALQKWNIEHDLSQLEDRIESYLDQAVILLEALRKRSTNDFVFRRCLKLAESLLPKHNNPTLIEDTARELYRCVAHSNATKFPCIE